MTKEGDIGHLQLIQLRLRTSQCFTKLASEFVVESSLLGICYFNGKNREKNSRKLMMSFVVTHPSM